MQYVFKTKKESYISNIKYNFISEPFYEIKKGASVHRLTKVAQEIIETALPIKCLEAVVLGLYLTMEIPEIERIAMSFKSISNSEIYRHIVLVVKHGPRYGAIGLSRKKDLMYKPIIYDSLSQLIKEYQTSYIKNDHYLDKVKIGLPITKNPLSNEPLVWKKITISITADWNSTARDIDLFAKCFR